MMLTVNGHGPLLACVLCPSHFTKGPVASTLYPDAFGLTLCISF